ncbi:TRAP transporter small permease [Enterocloster clostridioformis]|uniref:TRAP transporter small permease n=1 Tax=Enterocloster clostridioformis TaxID=1531 RepID=UPI00267471BF|nr:TRAP transporter small permease [Enterocloster clostridioformis]
MKGIKSVFIKMQRINTVIISLALLAMVGVVFLQTFCRFVIFRSLSWSEELSRYLFVTLIVLGVNLAITNHLFVRIEIIDNYLKGTAAVMMNLIRKFIMIYVNIVFVYSSFKLILIGAYHTSPAMRIPMSLLYGIIFIGFAMNVFASLIDLYETYVRVPEEEVK